MPAKKKPAKKRGTIKNSAQRATPKKVTPKSLNAKKKVAPKRSSPGKNAPEKSPVGKANEVDIFVVSVSISQTQRSAIFNQKKRNAKEPVFNMKSPTPADLERFLGATLPADYLSGAPTNFGGRLKVYDLARALRATRKHSLPKRVLAIGDDGDKRGFMLDLRRGKVRYLIFDNRFPENQHDQSTIARTFAEFCVCLRTGKSSTPEARKAAASSGWKTKWKAPKGSPKSRRPKARAQKGAECNSAAKIPPVKTLNPGPVFTFPESAVYSTLAISPDGRWLAGGEHGLHLWDIQNSRHVCQMDTVHHSGKTIRLSIHEGESWAKVIPQFSTVAFGPEGKRLFTIYGDKNPLTFTRQKQEYARHGKSPDLVMLCCWDLTEHRARWSAEIRGESRCSFSFRSKGQLLATTSFLASEEPIARVWDAERGEALAVWPKKQARFGPKRLLSIFGGRTARLLDAKTRVERHVIRARADIVNVLFSADEALVVLTGETSSCVFSTKHGHRLAHVSSEAHVNLWGLVETGKGPKLCLVREGEVSIYAPKTGALERTLHIPGCENKDGELPRLIEGRGLVLSHLASSKSLEIRDLATGLLVAKSKSKAIAAVSLVDSEGRLLANQGGRKLRFVPLDEPQS